MEIKLSEVKLKPILSSVKRLDISDEVYFGPQYKQYISNSRLKLIDPSCAGSPSAYKAGFTGKTTGSLSLGSNIHMLYLQPEEFELVTDVTLPNGKLGLACEKAIRRYKKGGTIENAIIQGCKDADYYANSLTDTKIRNVLRTCVPYYYKMKDLDDSKLVASERDLQTIITCLKNLKECAAATKLIHPTDMFGDPIDSFNEDTILIDYKCEYNGKSCILKFKMKADNWTIDKEDKVLTLNDLKTTGKPISMFMQNSFKHYGYARQLGAYQECLRLYCKKEFGVTIKDWTFSTNIIAVETIGDNRAGVFKIYPNQLKKGREEFYKLMKMVGICEMFGYNDDIEFLDEENRNQVHE
jgi:hypothetical protein